MESQHINYFLEQDTPLDLSLSYSVAPYPIPFAQILRESGKEIQAEKVVSLKKNAYYREEFNPERTNYGVLHIVEQKPIVSNRTLYEKPEKEVSPFCSIADSSRISKFKRHIDDQQRKCPSVNPYSKLTTNYPHEALNDKSADDCTLVISYKNNHWYYNNEPEEQRCTFYYKEEVEPPKTYSIKDLLITIRMDT